MVSDSTKLNENEDLEANFDYNSTSKLDSGVVQTVL